MTDEGKSGPAGEAKYCREGSGGFDGDGEGLLLAIFEGTGGAAEDNAAVVYGGKSGESGRWEDGPGGNEKPTFVDAERDTSRSENADGVSGNEIGYASINKEAGIINEGGYPTGGGTTTGMFHHRHGLGFEGREE